MGRQSSIRFDRTSRTVTARLYLLRSCWKDRFLSEVTSIRCCAPGGNGSAASQGNGRAAFSRCLAVNPGLLEQGRAGLFEKSDRLSAFDTRKAFEEIFQRVPGAEIINEVPHRHPCAREHRFSAQDLRVNRDELGLRGQMLPARGLDGKPQQRQTRSERTRPR